MTNYIVEEMDKVNADGVDFVPIFTTKDTLNKIIYMSKTRQEMIEDPGCPRTGRLYWKIVEGQKIYLD